jgi:hypothetical protein
VPGVGMAMNIGQCFLRDAEKRNRDRAIFDPLPALVGEFYAQASPDTEAARKIMKGRTQSLMANRRRIMGEGEGADFPIDPKRSLFDLGDDLYFSACPVDLSQVRNAQPQREKQLAGRVVELPSKA